jgi:small-conductance mechanosensitive channel
LGLLGADLTRFSVRAGALGVGIGFGLQRVVNNFLCGLILLFERPILVGDTIERGEPLGEVRLLSDAKTASLESSKPEAGAGGRRENDRCSKKISRTGSA